MRDLARTVAVVLGTAGAVFGMGLLAPERPATALTPVTGTSEHWHVFEPQEDDPGWDCETMGNESCD